MLNWWLYFLFFPFHQQKILIEHVISLWIQYSKYHPYTVYNWCPKCYTNWIRTSSNPELCVLKCNLIFLETTQAWMLDPRGNKFSQSCIWKQEASLLEVNVRGSLLPSPSYHSHSDSALWSVCHLTTWDWCHDTCPIRARRGKPKDRWLLQYLPSTS